MIEIDGGYGSGGGQILRTAVGLSALLGKPCRIFNIRAGRPRPGLAEQHLQAILAVSEYCHGKLTGAEVGSREITFIPGDRRRERIAVKIATAGSVGLVLQALMIAAVETGLELEIKGGATFGKWAVPVHYLVNVLCPLLEQAGYPAEITVQREGFYPVGGARVTARLKPGRLHPVRWENPGRLAGVAGISIASEHLRRSRVSERQAAAAAEIVERKLNRKAELETRYVPADCPGSGIVIWGRAENAVLGGDSLGERGKPAEKVGREAAEKLVAAVAGGGLDHHAVDQLIPYAALTGGSMVTDELTDHILTNLKLVETFLPVESSVQGRKITIKSTGRTPR